MVTKREGKKAGEKEGRTERTSYRPLFFCSYLLFFALGFVWLWLVVRPDLVYYCFGTILPDVPQFATGWSFLRDLLGTPGGPVIYAAGFLSQGYYYASLGAGIIVLAGFCLAELSRRHLVAAGLVHASVPAAVPAVALFLIYSRYRHPLPVCLAVSLGLLLSLVFEKLPLRRSPARVPVCCLMVVAGFWLGGGGALLVFALMTAVYGILTRRSGRVHTPRQQPRGPVQDGVRCTAYRLLALPAGVAIVWILTENVFLLPARQAFLILTPFAPSATAGMDTFLKTLTFLLYGFVPLTVLLVFVGTSVLGRHRHKRVAHPKKTGRKGKHAAIQRRRPSMAVLAKPALSAVPIVLMALGLYLSHDELRKSYVLSNYYWCQKRWDRILELSTRLPKNKNNIYVNHDIIRALYHTGRLPYDMFRYPQDPQAILLTHEKTESDLTQRKLSDLFLELGHVNMAQKLASELLTTKDHLGIALEELGWISIIKGHPRTARVYLEALKRNPLYRGRAESLLSGLDNGFTREQAAYIDRIRSCMRDETVGVTGAEPVDETLAALLEHNPRNRMAFEYLMACYLLTGRVDKIAENMRRLSSLGYQKVPTLYQEAIAIHYASERQPVDLSALGISVETVQRYETFVRLASTMQAQNRQAVFERLIRDFGTSYFFYYAFGRVGLA